MKVHSRNCLACMLRFGWVVWSCSAEARNLFSFKIVSRDWRWRKAAHSYRLHQSRIHGDSGSIDSTSERRSGVFALLWTFLKWNLQRQRELLFWPNLRPVGVVLAKCALKHFNFGQLCFRP